MDQGQPVVLGARNGDRLDDVAESLGGVPTYRVDATNLGEVADLVAAIDTDHGGTHGIVNALGSILIKPAHTTPNEEWRATLASNLDTAFEVVRATGSTFSMKGRSVVLLSSAAARTGLPGHEAIAAAKPDVIGPG